MILCADGYGSITSPKITIFLPSDVKHASDSINGSTERKSAEVIPNPLSKSFQQLFKLLNIINKILVLLLAHPNSGKES